MHIHSELLAACRTIVTKNLPTNPQQFGMLRTAFTRAMDAKISKKADGD
ncbi:hypothetical protein RSAG8_02869, partial [Rhizoctonia solani AG-8 WAC10335]